LIDELDAEREKESALKQSAAVARNVEASELEAQLRTEWFVDEAYDTEEEGRQALAAEDREAAAREEASRVYTGDDPDTLAACTAHAAAPTVDRFGGPLQPFRTDNLWYLQIAVTRVGGLGPALRLLRASDTFGFDEEVTAARRLADNRLNATRAGGKPLLFSPYLARAQRAAQRVADRAEERRQERATPSYRAWKAQRFAEDDDTDHPECDDAD
jgi:hypothetical protein